MIIQHTTEELQQQSQQRFDRATQDLRVHRQKAQIKGLLVGAGLVVIAVLLVVGARLLFNKPL